MIENLRSSFEATQAQLKKISEQGYGFEDQFRIQNMEKYKKILIDSLHEASPEIQKRVLAEYFSFGPLEELFSDESITEILVNGPHSIWFEKNGRLEKHPDEFLSESTYSNFFHRVCESAQCQSTVEYPTATAHFKDFRLTVIRQELTRTHHHFSFRRHPKNPWTFERLAQMQWASAEEISKLQNLVHQRKNFVIVGGTGSGKTSLINALLQTLPPNERALVIEDTPEIELPNESSMKLITREDPQGLLKTIDQGQLLRHSLRLRPDRIVMGEIRGSEAKDLLMALATGHGGSFGTLHASDPRQALIRLEMLIQIGAPQWSLQAVRRLIQLSLDCILVVEKTSAGKRKFQGLYNLCSLEENGFLLERA